MNYLQDNNSNKLTETLKGLGSNFKRRLQITSAVSAILAVGSIGLYAPSAHAQSLPPTPAGFAATCPTAGTFPDNFQVGWFQFPTPDLGAVNYWISPGNGAFPTGAGTGPIIASGGDLVVGPGLTATLLGITAFDLTGLNQPTAAAAFNDGDWVQYEFTTGASFPAGGFFDMHNQNFTSTIQSNLAVLLSEDPNFSTAVQILDTDLRTAPLGRPSFPATSRVGLDPSTTYYVRLIYYNTTGSVFNDDVTFSFGTCVDYSDTPATYTNTSHALEGTPSHILGASVDPDINPIPSADATQDGADDNGITIPALTQGQTATFSASVTGAGGFLQGWIDFDGSTVFDAGEQIAVNLQDDGTGADVAAGDGIIQFDVAVPQNASTNQTFSRFRWSTTNGLNATNIASDGEVEDYGVTVAAAPEADLVTTKTLSGGSATPAIGDTVTYQIAVRNDGPADATDVTLTDELPAGLIATANNGNVTSGSYDDTTGIWTIPTLANGATATLTLEGVVSVFALGDEITNITTAATSPNEPDPDNSTDDLEEVINVEPGSTGGLIAAPICTPLSSFTTFDGGLPTAGDIGPHTVTAPNGEVMTLSFSSPTSGNFVTGRPLFADTPLAGGVSRVLSATGGGSGSVATYSFSTARSDLQFTVGNIIGITGNVEGAEVIGFNGSTPVFPSFIALNLGAVIAGSNQNVILDSDGGSQAAAQFTFTSLVDRVEIRAPAGVTQEFLTYDLRGCFGSADIVTSKTLATGSSAAPLVGDSVSYSISVTNNGPDDTENVTLTDQLPAGISYTGDSATAGSYDDATGVWTIPTLNDGDTETLTLTGTIDTATGGQTITNIATAATSILPDPVTTTDDLQEAIVVSLQGDLSVTKTNTPGVNGEVDQASDTVVSGNDTTYTITVTNNGPDSVDGAIITDTIGTGLTCDPANSVTIGGSGVPSGSFTIGDLTGTGITLGTLADGESATLTYTCQVN